MKNIFLSIVLLFTVSSYAQETFMVNGTHNKNHNYYAFTNATIFTDYQTKIENGVLLIKDGKIIDVGVEVSIPENAIVYDLKGKFIYPSLIDVYSDYGLPKPNKDNTKKDLIKPKGAYNWNQAIHPETEAGQLFVVENKQAEAYRKLGFGTVLIHQKDGIMRGTSALVTLGNKKANEELISNKVASHLSFNKGTSTQSYPGSLMGMIALIRQTYYDADWYYENEKTKEFNISLAKVVENWGLPQIFEANDKLNILRADKVGDEFETQYIFKGNGNEYQRISEVKATGGKLILPVKFPKAFDVADPYDAKVVAFSDVKHWELAPFNLGIVAKNNIDFAITTADLKDKKTFFKALKIAIKSGLTEEQALKALTFSPANFINQYDKVGSLEKGKLANFLISSNTLFANKNVIHENWINGVKYIINDYNKIDIRGEYHVNINRKVYDLKVKGELDKPSGIIDIIKDKDTTKVKTIIKVVGDAITLSFNPKDDFQDKIIRLSGIVNGDSRIWDGNGQLSDGTWVKWSAIKSEKHKSEEKKEPVKDSLEIPQVLFPNMAYGFDSIPEVKSMLFRNVTVWTNEKLGVLKNMDVLLKDGKIDHIVKHAAGMSVDGTVEVIDGTGKHLTAGIIDEHSHIAISKGVNECTQAVTAEVSIADVVNSFDINIYRQLAGGVVASHLLHGSCNPVGGQSAIIKLKWGASPDSMKIPWADGFIKFALGENVKRAGGLKRFPQTRMGVEQVYYDAFIRAKEYDLKWGAYSALSDKEKKVVKAPRIDLELETVLEILKSERFISCHSYQQSEINMLMHVADSMGFTVNTFTHILEGYKVADKMKKHGAGGSTFSDWWAYKFEVNDAIPYNGAIMHEQGVVTAYNSDDAEMGRRLNQEAAKAVKYGGVSEEEAWKFVTLNPAKLLHLDTLMGSIKIGKDADVVLWSDNPLSIYAKAEKTIIEGVVYYDIERDKEMRLAIRKEKARIIQKMIVAKNNGEKTQEPKAKTPKLYHCDSVD